jgi:XTP/dITP diphosphohydrolase
VRRTVILLSPRMGAVLPVAALGALRAADRVLADSSVPLEIVTGVGAVPVAGTDPLITEVLITADPGSPWLAPPAEVITTPEPTGAVLLDAVAVMDRLRSPGGCPWDAEQTHLSLLQYLIEEAYELYQAITDDDRPAVREELGDVLLQVLFHARVASEGVGAGGVEPFDIDAVAADLVAKLVNRHPHVFAGTERVRTSADQEHRWEELKHAEKQRESSVDGVALAQPALALAAKLVSRTARAGLPADLLPDGSGVGERLFAVAAAAKLAGIDPEADLRATALAYAADVREAEDAARSAGLDPRRLDPDGWRTAWPG